MSCIFLLFFFYRAAIHDADQVLWVSQSLSIQKLVILFVVYIRSLRFHVIVLFNLYCIISLSSLGRWSVLERVWHLPAVVLRQFKGTVLLEWRVLQNPWAKASWLSSLKTVTSEGSTFDLLVVWGRVYYACPWLLFVIWRWYLYISSVLIYRFISSLAPGNQLLHWSGLLLVRFLKIHLVVPQEIVNFRLATLEFLIIWVLVLYIDVRILLGRHKPVRVRHWSIPGLLPRSFWDSFFRWAFDIVHLRQKVLFHISS